MTQFKIKSQPITKQLCRLLSQVAAKHGKYDDSAFFNKLASGKSFLKFNYRGEVDGMLCPYHNDHTIGQSFAVSERGIKCWACGKDSSIITAKMFLTQTPLTRTHKPGAPDSSPEIEDVNTFAEIYSAWNTAGDGFLSPVLNAIETYPELAAEFADVLKKQDQLYTKYPQTKKLLNLFRLLSAWHTAENDKIVNDFLEKRGFYRPDFKAQVNANFYGLSAEDVGKQIIAFYTAHNQDLIGAKPWQFSNDQELIEYLAAFGLFDSSQKGYYSVLMNRISVPLSDENGRVINFDLRLYDETKPSAKPGKYLFLKTSAKDNVKIQQAIIDANMNNMHHLYSPLSPNTKLPVYVNEGIYDTLSLNYNGVPAVCAFTKALTIEQINLLKQYKEVIISFDNDEAGVSGAVKTCQQLAANGIQPLIFLPPTNYNGVACKDWNDVQKLHVKPDETYEETIQRQNAFFGGKRPATSKNKFLKLCEQLINYNFDKTHKCRYFIFQSVVYLAELTGERDFQYAGAYSGGNKAKILKNLADLADQVFAVNENSAADVELKADVDHYLRELLKNKACPFDEATKQQIENNFTAEHIDYIKKSALERKIAREKEALEELRKWYNTEFLNEQRFLREDDANFALKSENLKRRLKQKHDEYLKEVGAVAAENDLARKVGGDDDDFSEPVEDTKAVKTAEVAEVVKPMVEKSATKDEPDDNYLMDDEPMMKTSQPSDDEYLTDDEPSDNFVAWSPEPIEKPKKHRHL